MPVDPTVFHVDFGEGKTIKKLTALISERRLVVVAIVSKHKGQLDHGDILIWDWRNGHRMIVSLPNSAWSKYVVVCSRIKARNHMASM